MCADGRLNAEEQECEEAVRACAGRQNLTVVGVQQGSWSWVPPGCSYSHDKRSAVFNRDPKGSNDGQHQLACKVGRRPRRRGEHQARLTAVLLS